MFSFKKEISPIDGWLTEDEANFLYKSAFEIPGDGIIIEIGSWKGRSTICFALGARDGNKPVIYAVDPHTGSAEHVKKFGKVDTYSDFVENINNAGVSEYIIPKKDFSENVANLFKQKIDFLLIDGAHDYKNVKLDYISWFPKLKNNCKVAFHDCWQAPGVHFFTLLLLLTSNKIKNPQLIDTLTIVQKSEDVKFTDRLKNILFILYRLFTGWIGVIKIDNQGTVIR